MKCTRITLSLIAVGLLAACSSSPSTEGQTGAAVEDRSSGAASSGVDSSRVVPVDAGGANGKSAYRAQGPQEHPVQAERAVRLQQLRDQG